MICQKTFQEPSDQSVFFPDVTHGTVNGIVSTYFTLKKLETFLVNRKMVLVNSQTMKKTYHILALKVRTLSLAYFSSVSQNSRARNLFFKSVFYRLVIVFHGS